MKTRARASRPARGRGREAEVDRDVAAYLAQTRLPRSEIGRGHRVSIDHSRIPHEDLRLALEAARLDPDGQVFPWRSDYPLSGGTVYYDGRLWTVAGRRERGPLYDESLLLLVGQGHDGEITVARGELRPVTWTQRDEDWLGRG